MLPVIEPSYPSQLPCMQHQQEIGGAQALLQLNKQKEDDEQNQALNHDDNPLNEVEAAVMRYVGGTLEKSKRPSTEVNMNDINQWILDDFDAFPDILAKKLKKRKLMNVDPELTGLVTDHDQLVQDAILNASEISNQMDNEIMNYNSNNNDNNIEHHRGNNGDSINSSGNHNIIKRKPAGSKKKSPSELDPVQQERKFKHITNIETLVEEASHEPCQWYNSQPPFVNKGPRMFSEIETIAVDHFINGYCHLYNLSREDICNRIWSSDRKKDDFWEPLTRVLPYRSRASVYKHVRRQYHIFEVRAKWTKDEDELLRKLALSQEGRWKEVGEAMGRMPEDCRDRWRNYVKCGENRSSNKWSESEENQFINIVKQFISNSKEKTPSINWTIISEKMNGVRSRIQCRYKWNKLIKKESALRAAYMSLETKLWLLHKLHQFSSPDLIDWKYIFDLYNQDFKHKLHENKFVWEIADFKAGFDLMKSESGDIRGYNIDFQNYIGKLINERSFAEPHESDLDISKEETSPSNIASAAVAAAASTSLEAEGAQPQEYSLWR